MTDTRPPKQLGAYAERTTRLATPDRVPTGRDDAELMVYRVALQGGAQVVISRGQVKSLHLDMPPPMAKAVLDVAPIARLSFTCPHCDRVSYHPADIAHGYCGACHDWTARR